MLTYEEALKIVDTDMYPIKHGIQFVKKVIPFTEKYKREFEYDLLVRKYKLYNEDVKNYALDNKFGIGEYRLTTINEIFM